MTNAISPDQAIAEAGRQIMAGQLDILFSHLEAVAERAEETAVHETRKAIRRTFTAFKLFAPFFQAGIFAPYHRQLKKMMRRLGRARDLAVVRQKLAGHMATAESGGTEGLPALAAIWQEEQEAANAALQQHVRKVQQGQRLAAYLAFSRCAGEGALPAEGLWTPCQVRHLAPVLIYQRLAVARACQEIAPQLRGKPLHELRIQMKELRYTLDFFQPVLGRSAAPAIDQLNRLQDVLGDLHDADVALGLLAAMPGAAAGVAAYQAIQEREMARLHTALAQEWSRFIGARWRRQLSQAIAIL